MTFRMLLAAALFGFLPCLPANARDLTVFSRGGLLQQAQEDAFFIPFRKVNGGKLEVGSWGGGLPALRTAADRWDVALVTADELLAGCDDLFEKLNWTALGGRDRLLPQAVSDCGMGSAMSDTVLAWDRDKFAATPSWVDFWDVARYPGKRGLRRGARTNLEIALMADGVAPGDVYRILRTDDGVDRAFRKLDQIKPYLVWWTAESPATQMLGSGDVLLTSADSVAVSKANGTGQRHFGIQWNGGLFSVLSWAVAKGTPNAADSNRLLAFMAEPTREALFAAALPFGPVTKSANELLPPDLQATSPTAPANLANAVPVDEQFWRDSGDRLGQRFDSWLAH